MPSTKAVLARHSSPGKAQWAVGCNDEANARIRKEEPHSEWGTTNAF